MCVPVHTVHIGFRSMEEAAYNRCLEDAATRARTTVAQAVATMTATTVIFVTPAPPAECGGAFLTEQAALIMAPPKDPTTLDHQLVLDIIQSMPNCDPNTFQFILY